MILHRSILYKGNPRILLHPWFPDDSVHAELAAEGGKSESGTTVTFPVVIRYYINSSRLGPGTCVLHNCPPRVVSRQHCRRGWIFYLSQGDPYLSENKCFFASSFAIDALRKSPFTEDHLFHQCLSREFLIGCDKGYHYKQKVEDRISERKPNANNVPSWVRVTENIPAICACKQGRSGLNPVMFVQIW